MSDTRIPLLGTAWYPEQWPEDRWPEDARLMREAGLTVVRLAEFAWCRIQPREDAWDWGWVDRAIEVLSREGLRVILCTPSAAPPPWLLQQDGVAPVCPETGRTRRYHHRRLCSPHSALLRRHAVEVARRMAERYGSHPAVFGFQIDNEIGSGAVDAGPLAQKAWSAWLARRFGSVSQLNRSLGLGFWSQEVESFDQIPPPLPWSCHPALKAEWMRFISAAWVEFTCAQVQAMRPLVRGRPITTNVFTFNWKMPLDWHALMREAGLDLLGWDNYVACGAPTALYGAICRALSGRQWVLEQQCGLPEGQHIWPDEERRLERSAHEAITGGADLLCFFHWRQGLAGCEQHHGAILDHDGRPGVTWERVRALALELKAKPPAALPACDLGLLMSWNDAWCHDGCRSSQEPVWFDLLLQTWKGVHAHRPQASIVFEPKHLRDLHCVVALARMTWDAEWEQALLAFVEGGGTLVTGPGFQRRDALGLIRPTWADGPLEQKTGLRRRRIIPLRAGHSLGGTTASGTVLRAAHWLEEIEPGQGSVLATCQDGPLPGTPLLVACRLGRGTLLHWAALPEAQALTTSLACL